jgi:glyoxylase-like metal-dependent hydrolase (beta-lactamase superfamily II)
LTTTIDVGRFRVTALSDGTVFLPQTYYPGLDFDAHPELVSADGTYHIPAGCFLIQGPGVTILVDAGIGPVSIPFPPEIAAAAGLIDPPEYIAAGGQLPQMLQTMGVDPSDIATVCLTHLDADHVGWVAPHDVLFFPNADVICSAAELARPAGPAPGEAEGRRGLAIAEAAGRLRVIDAATVPLGPGIAAHHTPGHTPGHYAVSVSSDGREAWLLGDAIHHPLQLVDERISFLLEATPDEALRTRERLLSKLAGRNVPVNMAHRPGLAFHVIALENGQRRWLAI